MATGLPSIFIQPFDVLGDPTTQTARWKKWVSKLQNFLVAHNITDADQKKSILLLYAGDQVSDIYDIIPDADKALGENEDAYEKVVALLNLKFKSKTNLDFEINRFRQCVQKPNETLDQYYSELLKLASSCNFHDINREIRTQIVHCGSSGRVRRKALREPNLSVTDLLDFARTADIAEKQAALIENVNHLHINNADDDTHQHVNYIKPKNQYKTKEKQNKSLNNTCRNCGREYPHVKSPCPAAGKTCNSCQKVGHFWRMCRSSGKGKPKQKFDKRDQTVNNKPDTERQQEVNHVTPQPQTSVNTASNPTQQTYYCSSDEDEYVFSVHALNGNLPYADIVVNNKLVPVLIDTGSTINILDKNTYESLEDKPCLTPTQVTIYTYGSNKPLNNLLGYFTAKVTVNNVSYNVNFYVVDMKTTCLIGHSTAIKLKLIAILDNIHVTDTPVSNEPNISPQVKVTPPMVSDQLCNEYHKIFEGIGKLNNYKVKLHIDESVKPVIQKHRRIPFHLREAFEQQLKREQEQDLIEPAEGPTPWVNQVVLVPKPKAADPNQIRICVDMREPNRAIQRERHITPTNDEFIHDLNGAVIFSKLDLKAGYHQLELDEESRYITTFSTHAGLFRYKRLTFGICSAAEIFQNIIQQIISDIPGAKNVSDDIIVFGKSQADHDENLKQTFKRIYESGLTLNKSKCAFNKSRLEYNGNVYSAEGIAPDPKKVAAIRDFPIPSNASEVRSLLGMATYCSRFIPNFATINEPLRELTKQNVPFKWTVKHDKSVKLIVESLVKATSMSYFDPQKQTEVVCDASPFGLGCILAQRESESSNPQIIAYASRALSDTERRYSQTEREALSLVWGCEHFKLYLLGNKFNLVTDHKPLQLIFNNPRSKPPARIERWALRLQNFNYNVIYRKGCENPADYMSRHPARLDVATAHSASHAAEAYLNHIATFAIPEAMTLDEVISETESDETLQTVKDMIANNRWYLDKKTIGSDKSDLQSFINIHGELCVTSSGIVLRGTRIVLPKKLRDKAIT